MRDNKNNTGFHKLLLSFQNDTIKANTIPITRYISSSFNDSILSQFYIEKKRASIPLNPSFDSLHQPRLALDWSDQVQSPWPAEFSPIFDPKPHEYELQLDNLDSDCHGN